MKELHIDWDRQVVRHKGVDINLLPVKLKIAKMAPELIVEYRFCPKFNNETGDIDYKYAWDSIFFEFDVKVIPLKKIFDIILNERQEL